MPDGLHRRPYAGLRHQGELHDHRRRRLGKPRPARPHQGNARLQHRCRRPAAEMPQLPSLPSHRRGLLRPEGPLALLLGPLGQGRRGRARGGRHHQHPDRPLPRLREHRHRLRDDHGHPRRRRRRRRDLGAPGDRGRSRPRAGSRPERKLYDSKKGQSLPAGVEPMPLLTEEERRRSPSFPPRTSCRGMWRATGT